MVLSSPTPFGQAVVHIFSHRLPYVSVLTPVLPLPSPRSDQTCALSDQFLYLNLLFCTWLTYCPDDWKFLKCWSVSSSNITEDMYIDKCLFFQGLLWICQTSIYMLAGLFMQCRMKLRWSYFNYILTLHDYQNLQTLEMTGIDLLQQCVIVF